jgi:hypothetical protein
LVRVYSYCYSRTVITKIIALFISAHTSSYDLLICTRAEIGEADLEMPAIWSNCPRKLTLVSALGAVQAHVLTSPFVGGIPLKAFVNIFGLEVPPDIVV